MEMPAVQPVVPTGQMGAVYDTSPSRVATQQLMFWWAVAATTASSADLLPDCNSEALRSRYRAKKTQANWEIQSWMIVWT